MSDACIHLILKYMATFDPFVEVSVIFPQTDKSIHFNSFTEMDEHHEKIEALVRSLAGDPIQYKKCPFCDDTWPYEQILTSRDEDCCYKAVSLETSPLLFKWSDQPLIIAKNDKLKVTFGSGTWVHTCRKTCITLHITTKLELPKEIIEKQIIESLQPLEKACHELGVEILWE